MPHIDTFTDAQETGRKDSQTGDAAPAYEGPEVMAEDGGDVNLGGDITSDEMQMMMSMGIPFGFDTTQARVLIVAFHGYQHRGFCYCSRHSTPTCAWLVYSSEHLAKH